MPRKPKPKAPVVTNEADAGGATVSPVAATPAPVARETTMDTLTNGTKRTDY